jgi:hypothetical protein
MLVAEVPAQPFFVLLTRKRSTVKTQTKGLCAMKKISKPFKGAHLMSKAETMGSTHIWAELFCFSCIPFLSCHSQL